MYVYESFKHHPFRFIRKSHIDELDEALTSAIKKIENNKEKYIYQCRLTTYLQHKGERHRIF